MPFTQHSIVRPGDLVFAAVLLGAAALCALFIFLQPPGQTVVFRQDGKEVGRYSLSEDRTVEIQGEYLNIFQIRNGRVWVVETTCPNHTCEAAGAISRSGASIICTPNHVSVTIEGSSTLDATTG